MTIEKVLEEISAIPGVTGSYIFHPDQGPIHITPELKLAVSAMEKIGSCVVRMLKMGKLNGFDIGAGHYRFDNCSSLVTPLDHGAVLVTICETKANCSLTAKTAGMLATDLSSLLQQDTSPPPPARENEKSEVTEVKEAAAPEEDIQDYLDQIKEALAEAIGPVAGMIAQDHIARWQSEGPQVAARLKELISSLADEIDDNNLLLEFRKKTANIK